VKLLKNNTEECWLKLPCSVSVMRHYRDLDQLSKGYLKKISAKRTNRTKTNQKPQIRSNKRQ
ncbi:hypothetical protein, partial [Photobacterium marinum]|uniref:hypothetical protein n=1 Tax=Photobacterium marinum TaxID=1056511 RepID=UPI001E5FA1D4